MLLLTIGNDVYRSFGCKFSRTLRSMNSKCCVWLNVHDKCANVLLQRCEIPFHRLGLKCTTCGSYNTCRDEPNNGGQNHLQFDTDQNLSTGNGSREPAAASSRVLPTERDESSSSFGTTLWLSLPVCEQIECLDFPNMILNYFRACDDTWVLLRSLLTDEWKFVGRRAVHVMDYVACLCQFCLFIGFANRNEFLLFNAWMCCLQPWRLPIDVTTCWVFLTD